MTLALDGAETARGLSGRARERSRAKAVRADRRGRRGGTKPRSPSTTTSSRWTIGGSALVEAARGLRVLVVDGDPRTVRTEDETFFLEAALRAGGSGFSVATVLPDELGERDLSATGAIFIANVSRPSPAAAAALERYVRGGGGLFVSVGDKCRRGRVESGGWAASCRSRSSLATAVPRLCPARAPRAKRSTRRPAERLAPFDRRHPLLSGFPGPR